MKSRFNNFWEKNKAWLGPLSMALVLLVGMYIVVAVYASNSAGRHVKTTLETRMGQYADNLTTRVRQLYYTSEAAILAGDIEDDMQEEHLQEVASVVKQVTGCTRVLIADAQGNAITSDGLQIDLSEDPLITSASSAKSLEMLFDITRDVFEETSGDTMIRVTVPLKIDGEPVAYVICMDRAAQWMDDANVIGLKTVYHVLMDKEGKVWNYSGKVEKDSLDDYYAELSTETGLKERKLKNRFSISQVYTLNAKNGSRILTATLNALGNYVLLVEVPAKSVGILRNREMKTAHVLLIVFGLLIILFMLSFFFFNWVRHKKTVKHEESLEKTAQTDLLTGLKNKSATEQAIRGYMADYPNEPGLMFLLDVDDFKNFNDHYGHAFGDQVLREFAFRLSSHFRAADIVGRIGGDEFMVFCVKISDENAIRKKISDLDEFAHSFLVGQEMKREVTSSIGVARYPGDGDSFEALYKAADQAMYRAKNAGKGRVSE